MFGTNGRAVLFRRMKEMKRTYYGNYNYMDRVEEQKCRRIARQREVRRQKFFIIIGVIITMAFISFFSVRAFANTDNTSADCFGTKQYKSIKIYCGDTVGSIADEYYSFQFSSVDKLAEEIMKINHISPDEKLIPGNYLIVPFYDLACGY